VRRFDTAPHYGKGNAERRLGLFLKTLTDEQLAGVEVYTKVGRRLIPYEDLEAELMKPEVLGEEKEDGLFHGVGNVARVIDYSIKGIQRCVDESLERLNLPVSEPKCRLGIRLHDVDSPERWAEAQKEALQGMQSVRERGQVHEISLGLNEPEYINKFLNTKNHSLNSILSAGNWNLLDQSGAENFARCAKEGVEIHNAAVFAGGFLFGGKAWKFDEKDREKIEKVEGWRELCKEFSIDMGKAVMSFALLPKVRS
jgi:D-threo-aldose 1-dehydrogenase